MAIQQTFYNPGSGLTGYVAAILGDGISTSVSIDFFEQIAADKTVKNKIPTGIYVVNSEGGPATPTATLSGTTVTFTWAAAPAANALVDLAVYLTFNP